MHGFTLLLPTHGPVGDTRLCERVYVTLFHYVKKNYFFMTKLKLVY